jgi:lysophospholipase L1-like esterase
VERRTKIILGIGIGASLILTTLLIYFAKRNKVRIKNKNPKRILIVGDSQSAIKDSSGNKISFTYPNILQKDLSPQGITIDVLALGGKTTDWMKTNLPSQLSNNKYDRVIIYGGGNDTSNSSIPLETTLNNIQQMVEMARQNGADAFVNLGWKIQGDFGNYRIMPLTRYLDKQEDWIPYVEKRKQLQKLIPQKIQNANFIQPYDLQSLTQDGIHPNAEGHKLVAETIKKSILND